MRILVCYIFFVSSIFFCSSQELFIQSYDELQGSERFKGQEYTVVYDNTTHTHRYFDHLGNEIMLIKSYNEKGDQIALSIEKNSKSNALEIIIENVVVGVIVNSTIYNLDEVEIGKFYRGSYSEKKINNFWKGLDHRHANISIYDHSGVYKVGSFMFKQKVDHYAILGIEKIENVENLDPRSLKKQVRNIQRYYKKLIRKYDLKNNPDDIELQEEFQEISDSYNFIMKELGVDSKKEKMILGIVPQDYFSEEKRSDWSHDEGYVPYTKREIKDIQPDTKIKTDELYNNSEE